jgi:AAA domain
MSAAPVRIEAEAPPQRIRAVSDRPSVWAMESRVEWLIEGVVPRGSVILISAESGTGKTWLAYAIAGAVSHGINFTGRNVQQAPVLYLDGENPVFAVKRNLNDLGLVESPGFNAWGSWNEDPPPKPDDPRIIEFARRSRPLLIWDSLVEFAGCDEHSSTDIRAFMNKFRLLANVGATVIILHHTGKTAASKQYGGSSDIKASVDMAYVVTGRSNRGKLHWLTMKPFKSRIAPGQTFTMEFRERKGFVAVNAPKTVAKEDPSDIIRRIVTENPKRNGTWIKNLAKTLGVSKGQVDEILGSGEYSCEAGKGAEKLYSVVELETLDEALPDFPDPRVEEIRKSEETT